jgi:hypothetical protein
MAAQITDNNIATFATESTRDGLADALIEKYEGIATRIMLFNATGDHDRFERYGAITRGRSSPRCSTVGPTDTLPRRSQVEAPAGSSGAPDLVRRLRG